MEKGLPVYRLASEVTRKQEQAVEAEELLRKRLKDMAEKCYRSNIYTFSSFLSMAELDIFYRMQKEFTHVDFTLSGGREDSERRMIRFGSEKMLGYIEDFPIVCVEIAPLQQKFADELTHRDFLGALMNLGIERATLGDIIIYENKGYVFCTSVIAPFIMETLEQIKHTRVKCRMGEAPKEVTEPEMETRKIQAASERLDGVIAKVCGLSRGDSLELFRQKKVYLNGILCENNSILLKPEDIITVRGFGKFTYAGYEGISKKGKKNIVINMRRK